MAMILLTLLAKHAALDLTVRCNGDLHVDQHHTVEDVGICFGQALRQALGDKAGIRRYGHFTLPMDETLARGIRSAGYGLAVWTVNDPAQARQLFAWGVDAVFTDRLHDAGMVAVMFMAGMEIDFAQIRGRPLKLATIGWIASLAIGATAVGVLARVAGRQQRVADEDRVGRVQAQRLQAAQVDFPPSGNP